MTRTRPWTVDAVRALGVRTDLETGASIWGIGRTRAYELARAGQFPSPVVKIGGTYVVLVEPMLRALGVIDEASESTETGSATEPATATVHALATSSTGGTQHDPSAA